MTLPAALALARKHGMASDFWASYRQVKPWWAFWVNQDEAVQLALEDLDLAEWR